MTHDFNDLLVIAVGITVGLYFGKKWNIRQAFKRLRRMTESSDIDAQIIKKLQALRFAIDADKLKIFQFHNGGHFFSGHSIKKMTMTHVVCKEGVPPPEVTSLQNLPTSLFPNMMARFVKAEQQLIIWDAAKAPDIFIRQRHEVENLKSVVLLCIYAGNGVDPIGFLSCNYLNETPISIDGPTIKSVVIEIQELLN